jgi:hypothetical protein
VLNSDDVQVIRTEEEEYIYSSEEEVEERIRSWKQGISIISTASRQGLPAKNIKVLRDNDISTSSNAYGIGYLCSLQ